MDFPVDQTQEAELGRIAGLRYGRLIDLGIVVTSKRIIRINYGAATVRRWAGTILGPLLWVLVLISLRFLFISFPGIVAVMGLGLLPIFLILVPKYLERETKPIISEIPRDVVAKVMFKKPGIGMQRGSFRVNLANGELLDFWTSGRPKFEETLSVIQRFCDWSPAIPFVEDS